jgi:hypothetical protein
VTHRRGQTISPECMALRSLCVHGRNQWHKIPLRDEFLCHSYSCKVLRKLAEIKGVHYAREASGHQSDRYIWRYVKPDQ